MDTGEEMDEEGQHVKWAPVHVEQGTVLKSDEALQVEKLQFCEGCAYSP